MSTSPHITRIEWGRLEGQRPRSAGSNARLGPHGTKVSVPITRLTTSDGATGFGRAALSPDRAAALRGRSLAELYLEAEGVHGDCREIEYPLWDLIGKRDEKPVYALLADTPPDDPPLRVRCYDTSLYFDDLHLTDDAAAAALIAQEAREGWERGHRAFKIKVGRGAMHLPLEQGTRRDIAIVRAVREAVGAGIPLLLDANNGYNLNLTKRVLDETAEGGGIFWMEEAFHEDATLYRHLKIWLQGRGYPTLIADGEGDASRHLLDWARDGIVDVLQYDVFSPGFTHWLALGQQMANGQAHTAPHHYGAHLGNYVTCHLAPALPRFLFVEWDEVTTPGLDASGYTVHDGYVTVPAKPGFGPELEEAVFQQAVRENGFVVG